MGVYEGDCLIGMIWCLLAAATGTAAWASQVPSIASVSWSDIIESDGGSLVDFGVEIQGPSPFERETTTVFNPASNTKLFTSTAALKELGPDYRFETRLEWQRTVSSDPSRITGVRLIGSGDPSWGMAELGESLTDRFKWFADALWNRGVRQISGDVALIASDPRWDELRYPPGWLAEDFTACYGALAQAFNLGLNCGTFVVTSPDSGTWTDAGISIPVTLRISYGAHTGLTVEPVMDGNGPTLGFVVSGTWSRLSRHFALQLPIHDARTWVHAMLRAAIRSRGITFSSQRVTRPDPQVLSASYFSPPLNLILKPFMKESINTIADALFKKMGELDGPAGGDLLDAGREVMRAYVSTSQVDLYDGSGVSHSDTVTPAAILSLLETLPERSDFQDLWESLPIAGVDGTLKDRMIGTAAQGVLRAKTGTLEGVYNLSGYVPIKNADGTNSGYVPFVLLSRTDPENEKIARDAEDRVGAALTELVDPQLRPQLQ